MNKSKGIGFCAALALAFIVLKLVGIIHWSWLWVLSPIWVSAILWILFFVLLIDWLRR